MGLIPSKSVSSVMLTLTSLHCLRRVHKACKYARAGYRIYFFAGVCTVIRNSLVSPSDPVIYISDICFAWCYVLGLPLLASDVCRCSGLFPDFAALHLIIPTATLTTFHVNPVRLDPLLLAVSHTYSMISVVFCGALSGHSSAYAFVLTYFFAMFREKLFGGSGFLLLEQLNPVTPKSEMPDFMETWQFIISIGNLFSAYLLPRAS